MTPTGKDKGLTQNVIDKIKGTLDWEYKYKLAEDIPTKTSVSKIKEEKNKQKGIASFLKQEDETPKNTNNLAIPKFEKDENITPSARGTLIHLCFKNMDEKAEYTLESLKDLVESLKNKKIITPKEADAIPINVLLNYTKSNLFMELKNAKQIYKEEPFYINIPVNEIYEGTPKLQEGILVQGIIDLYYIDKNGNIILVDYKTDYVQDEKELTQKYKEQLNLYKDAIEKALNKNVYKTLIYSTCLQKEIVVK